MGTPLKLGCIADDFTGATDLANNLVRGGMRVVQAIGVPAQPIEGVDAVVVALAGPLGGGEWAAAGATAARTATTALAAAAIRNPADLSTAAVCRSRRPDGLIVFGGRWLRCHATYPTDAHQMKATAPEADILTMTRWT